MTPAIKDKQQLLADLEALHSTLAPSSAPLDQIPVLMEAVLDDEADIPDLSEQIDEVDELLGEEFSLQDIQLDALDIDAVEQAAEALASATAPKAAKAAPELQLDLGYDLHEDQDNDALPVDTQANLALSQIQNDPLDYTGDDLFINHENRESHFAPQTTEWDADPGEPPLLEPLLDEPLLDDSALDELLLDEDHALFAEIAQTGEIAKSGEIAQSAEIAKSSETENLFDPLDLDEPVDESPALLLDTEEEDGELRFSDDWGLDDDKPDAETADMLSADFVALEHTSAHLEQAQLTSLPLADTFTDTLDFSDRLESNHLNSTEATAFPDPLDLALEMDAAALENFSVADDRAAPPYLDDSLEDAPVLASLELDLEPELDNPQESLPSAQGPDLTPVFQALSSNADHIGDENPFLPAHLREKLRQSKAVLMEEIQRSSDAVYHSAALVKAYTEDNRSLVRERPSKPSLSAEQKAALVSSLVEELLPVIAEQLRERLQQALDQQDTPDTPSAPMG